jgi:hypothetical protein
MTTHAHGPGDSVSAAKLSLYGSIGTALIAAVSAIIVGVVNHDGGTVSKESTSTTFTPTALSEVSDRGSFDKVAINDSGTEVTVSGRAEKDVNRVFVLVGPKPSGGYWVGFADVLNQQWQADVQTEPRIPQPYTIAAYYYGPSGGGASQGATKFTFQPTEPTTPPSAPPADQIVDCAVQFGPSCFTDPGFGPPSVYKSNQ